MKRSCVLCKSMATIYCESDRASLCWTCDANVHSANFLVARHSRSLLCQICHSQTLWSSSGEKLCRSAAATCGTCLVEGGSGSDHKGSKGETGDGDGDEIDNQVVAWSSTAVPPASSSSSSEAGDGGGGLLKRKHQNVTDNSLEEEINSSSVRGRNKSRRTVDIDLNLSAIE